MKVIIDSAIPFIKGVLEPFAEVVYTPGDSFTADMVSDADALVVRTRTLCNRALLEGSKVKFIATATIGFDHIDCKYCAEKGIAVATAAGCNARGVLQWVSAVLVKIAKREGFVPSERTLGIVGVGNVGKLVKEYAERWGFRVVCCDPPRQKVENLDFVSLEELIPRVDILTLHTPLDSTTRGMISTEVLSTLRRGATVINASRGEVVKSEALLREDLTVAVDVWENEPNIDARLVEKAIVTTPHIAGYSVQGKANATALAVRQLAEYFLLPLTDWYPEGVEGCTPQAIDWQSLTETIDNYCNLDAESAPLKRGGDFELLRNNYKLRKEYF
ncbi:MAG: 4-phosphoerythronate dehydrogenase [Alistipes sp.]|nr:4-phosphoerythronate dehydrogenase [Alistipes sp.]